MSPKRKVSVNEFDQYIPAAGQSTESRFSEEENVNAFTFDKEFELAPGEDYDNLAVVDNVKASLIYPDALQPRPSPLPISIRSKFRRGDIDAFQAAREWLRLAEKEPVLKNDVDRYLSMGQNMAVNGQINPITGRWEQAVIRGKEKRIFRIETGEQRFWSAVIYHISQKQEPEELILRVSLVPAAVAPTEIDTIKRQISENRRNMQLTEVLQAREIARLLLATIAEKTGKIFPIDETDEYAYFRQVLSLGRVPHGVWDIVQSEFGLSQHRMRQSLEILNFPSNLLDLAHKTRLSYRTLSLILKQPEEEWEAAVWESAMYMIAQDEDETELGEETASASADGRPVRKPKKLVDPAELAFRGVRRFYRSAIKGLHSNPLMLQAVADNIIMDGYAEEVIDFMEDLIKAIRIRINEDD
jgi:hypothetical protein